MRPARQEFGGAFADPLGVLAAQKTAMVEEKLEQGQIVFAEVAAQKEVISQPTVEILDDRTGPNRGTRQLLERLPQGVITCAQSLAKNGLTLPALRLIGIDQLPMEELSDQCFGDFKALCQGSQVPVQLNCEGEHFFPMVGQQ